MNLKQYMEVVTAKWEKKLSFSGCHVSLLCCLTRSCCMHPRWPNALLTRLKINMDIICSFPSPLMTAGKHDERVCVWARTVNQTNVNMQVKRQWLIFLESSEGWEAFSVDKTWSGGFIYWKRYRTVKILNPGRWYHRICIALTKSYPVCPHSAA